MILYQTSATTPEQHKKFEEEDRRRLAEVMKDALPGDVISICDTFPAMYVNRSKLEREKRV